jgi:hypothetical protein
MAVIMKDRLKILGKSLEILLKLAWVMTGIDNYACICCCLDF